MNHLKGHDGLMVTGALAALAFTPQGLPRRQRATVSEIAARSAAFVGWQTEQHLAALAARLRGARSKEGELALRMRALRTEYLAVRYRPGRIADHLRGLLRDCALADHLKSGSFAPNLIVNAGEGFLVDAWQNLVELEAMKYHGCGTGVVAAAETDTALGAECTSVLNPDNTRATGSLGEASQSVFRTQATVTFDGAATVTEWGLFNQAATGGGTIWSRVVSGSNVMGVGDSLQYTYDLTVE